MRPMCPEGLFLLAGENFVSEAEALSEHLHVPLVRAAVSPDPDCLQLVLDENGLSLRRGALTLRGDFSELLPRLKEDNLRRELLVHAAKLRDTPGPVTVADATAGMGEDSLLLAAAGFRVVLFEYDPVIAALLRDTLRIAAEDPKLAETVSRMELREENSISALPEMLPRPDVVYLDPMFPERRKSALIKKKFQLLQQLERPCDDEAELLSAAIAAKPKRVIVKRPLKGPFLCGKTPSFSLKGKAIRYDCLLFPQNSPQK